MRKNIEKKATVVHDMLKKRSETIARFLQFGSQNHLLVGEPGDDDFQHLNQVFRIHETAVLQNFLRKLVFSVAPVGGGEHYDAITQPVGRDHFLLHSADLNIC